MDNGDTVLRLSLASIAIDVWIAAGEVPMGRGDGGGPFAYYPVAGEVIRVAAEAAAGGAVIDAVRRRVDVQHRHLLRAIGAEDQALAAARVRAAPHTPSAMFTAGVLRVFADAIDRFDHDSVNPRSVDKLNAAYADARASSFGLDPADYADDGPAADRDYDADWQAAYAQLAGPSGSLTSEYGRLEAELDRSADYAARMLARGPNPDDVRELWMSGALPPADAAAGWPELRLDQAPTVPLPCELRAAAGNGAGSADEFAPTPRRIAQSR